VCGGEAGLNQRRGQIERGRGRRRKERRRRKGEEWRGKRSRGNSREEKKNGALNPATSLLKLKRWQIFRVLRYPLYFYLPLIQPTKWRERGSDLLFISDNSTSGHCEKR
jgi:hypothetical protein